jgi:hypothetical protein
MCEWTLSRSYTLFLLSLGLGPSSDYRILAMDCESQIKNMLRVALSPTDYVTAWLGRICALGPRQNNSGTWQTWDLGKGHIEICCTKLGAGMQFVLSVIVAVLLCVFVFLSCSSIYNCIVFFLLLHLTFNRNVYQNMIFLKIFVTGFAFFLTQYFSSYALAALWGNYPLDC